jgi:hypothetical protein
MKWKIKERINEEKNNRVGERKRKTEEKWKEQLNMRKIKRSLC